MWPWLLQPGGPAARAAADQARRRLALDLDLDPARIHPAVSGSDANLQAVVEAARALRRAGRGGHVVAVAGAHSSLARGLEVLEHEGFRVTRCPLDARGQVAASDVVAASGPDTCLVSLPRANAETGVLHDTRAVGAALLGRVHLHADATQAAPWEDVRPRVLGVDTVTLSAHKLRGPRGAGLVLGALPGRPEWTRGWSTATWVGVAEAWARFGARTALAESVRRGRERLEAALSTLEGVEVVGATVERLPGTTLLLAERVSGEALVLELDRAGVWAASGSACSEGSGRGSATLRAMQLPPRRARGSLRLSASTPCPEPERVVEALRAALVRLRALADPLRRG